jgi:aminopeptidase N
VARHRGGSVETRDLVRAVEEATGWNGDRFFDQWVMRPGHPELKVEYGWDDEARQARLTVRQGQAKDKEKDRGNDAPPLFHLPLTVRFVVDGKVSDVRVTVERAEETFLIPLLARPEQAIVDLGNQFLKTLDLKKPDELWRRELERAEHAIDRVRAARALGKAGDPTAVPALEQAMRKDPFWAVRGEAALALGAIKSEGARAAVAAWLPEEQHPKARRLQVRALGAFRGDEKAADAVLKALGGDASYFVEAESAMALARTRSPRAYEALLATLHRPSFQDVVESQCLAGMAELRDGRAIEVALAALRYGQPVIGRRAAAAALGSLGAEHADKKRLVRETLVDLLEDPDFRARIAAVEALRVLGDADAVGPLRRAERRDLDGRVRRRAREVARALGEGAAQDEAVRTLRDTVEKLEGESKELRDRLQKLEARIQPPKDGGAAR